MWRCVAKCGDGWVSAWRWVTKRGNGWLRVEMGGSVGSAPIATAALRVRISRKYKMGDISK